VWFLVDFLAAGRHWRDGGAERPIFYSAAGITALVALFVVDVIVNVAWTRWLLTTCVGLLAVVMFPVWQIRMRRLARGLQSPHD
jgi:Flp pilus assembly protein TadB